LAAAAAAPRTLFAMLHAVIALALAWAPSASLRPAVTNGARTSMVAMNQLYTANSFKAAVRSGAVDFTRLTTMSEAKVRKLLMEADTPEELIIGLLRAIEEKSEALEETTDTLKDTTDQLAETTSALEKARLLLEQARSEVTLLKSESNSVQDVLKKTTVKQEGPSQVQYLRLADENKQLRLQRDSALNDAGKSKEALQSARAKIDELIRTRATVNPIELSRAVVKGLSGAIRRTAARAVSSLLSLVRIEKSEAKTAAQAPQVQMSPDGKWPKWPREQTA